MGSAPGRRIGAAERRRRLPGGSRLGRRLGGLAAGDGLLLLHHAGVAGVPVGGRALVLAKRRPESPGPPDRLSGSAPWPAVPATLRNKESVAYCSAWGRRGQAGS